MYRLIRGYPDGVGGFSTRTVERGLTRWKSVRLFAADGHAKGYVAVYR